MNGDEKVLREVLRSRAEDVDTVADFVGPSVGLARRRSRRAAAAGATAAVLVVSRVSVATWFAARPGTPEQVPATVAPAPSASATPSTTPTPSPSPSPTDTPSPSTSPTGGSSDVMVPWAAGSTVHLPGGAIDVGQGRVVRQVRRSRAAVRSSPPIPVTRAACAGGSSGPAATSRTTSAAQRGSRRAGRPAAGATGGDRRGGDRLRRARSRLGSSDLGGRVVAVADGWVWATSQTGTRGWEVATGDERTLDRRLVAVSADGRRAAATTPDDQGANDCWQVVDLTKRSVPVLLERCGEENPEGFVPREFSADGKLVIGTDDADGGFYSRLVLARVSDGRVLIGRSTHGEEVDGWTWALAPDGGSILFSRNIAEPRFPADRNDLARCTLGSSAPAPRVRPGSVVATSPSRGTSWVSPLSTGARRPTAANWPAMTGLSRGRPVWKRRKADRDRKLAEDAVDASGVTPAQRPERRGGVGARVYGSGGGHASEAAGTGWRRPFTDLSPGPAGRPRAARSRSPVKGGCPPDARRYLGRTPRRSDVRGVPRRQTEVSDATAPASAPAALDPVSMVRSKAYLSALVLAALLGIPISAIAYGFLALVG